jgi:hypothetical protein
MSTARAAALRFSAWIQTCGMVFILAGLCLAEGAGAWHFATTVLPSPEASVIGWSAIGYLLVAIAILLGLRWVYRRWGARTFLWSVVGLSLLIQLGAVLAAQDQLGWAGDALVFNRYLTHLSESAYAPETLGQLSQNYDYPIWTRRAQPFYYGLHVWSGPHFPQVIQLFQAGLITLALLLTWRLSCLLFSRRIGFWAVSLQVIMPYRWTACLDLNHHLLGGFYFLAGLWLLAEWVRPQRSRRAGWGIILSMSVLVPLMRLEGGIDTVLGGGILLVLLLLWAVGRHSFRRTAQGVALLLIGPWILSNVLLQPLSDHIDQADLHRSSSGTVAFMARGWMPESAGEYSYTYERLDALTPPDDKTAAQAGLLASQAYYNPRVLLFRLLPIKLTKYFLLGYAAGAEEMFDQNGAHRARQIAEGARTAYLLAILPLMVFGGLLLLPLLRRTRRLSLILPCSLFCIAIVTLGETSPRYSFYLQPLLFMLAALPFAWSARRRRQLLRASILPGSIAAGSLGGVLLIAAGILAGLRPWIQPHVYQDMRSWEAAQGTHPDKLPSTLAPMEIHLPPQSLEEGTSWGALHFAGMPDQPGVLSFYALPSGVPSGRLLNAVLVTEYSSGQETQIQTNALPGLIRVTCSSGASGTLTLRSPRGAPFPLHVGYATYEPAP